MDIKPGLVTALIGPSGCGKTTLLRCLNRINERYGNVTTTGRITVLGKNIYDPDVSLSELRKSVGMVFQRPNPLPISIRENVLFGVRVHVRRGTYSRAEQDAMVEAALRDVQLWDEVKDRLKKKATRLSLEQQQKLCIARLAAAEAAGDPHGRALLGPGRRGHRADRGPHPRACAAATRSSS